MLDSIRTTVVDENAESAVPYVFSCFEVGVLMTLSFVDCDHVSLKCSIAAFTGTLYDSGWIWCVLSRLNTLKRLWLPQFDLWLHLSVPIFS